MQNGKFVRMRANVYTSDADGEDHQFLQLLAEVRDRDARRLDEAPRTNESKSMSSSPSRKNAASFWKKLLAEGRERRTLRGWAAAASLTRSSPRESLPAQRRESNASRRPNPASRRL